MKRIIFLGASPFQLAPIRYAADRGDLHVITCDNKPNNPGHAMAHDSWNIDIREKEAILKRITQEGGIEGIVAFASDPAAPTAAWVAEQLGLPGSPYHAAMTMTYKDKWREFQKLWGFSAPQVVNGGKTPEYPFIVKPVDSSGSRGISIVHNKQELSKAVIRALEFSKIRRFIFEELVNCDDYQVAGDGFVVGGKLVFSHFANEHFAQGSGLVPKGESFPYIGTGDTWTKIRNEIQCAIELLGFCNGALNFDIRVCGGKIYLMEIGARAGGNFISEAIHHATGVNLAKYAVKVAMGEDCSDLAQLKDFPTRYVSTYMIHSHEEGRFKRLWVKNLDAQVLNFEMFINKGDDVSAFTGSHCTLGAMILEFRTQEQMLRVMESIEEKVFVELY